MNLFIYFIYIFVVLLIINIIGKILIVFTNINSNKRFHRLFFEMILGLVAIVIIYSIITTEIKTINILFIYVFMFYFIFFKNKLFNIQYRKNFKRVFINLHKDIFVIVLISIPFFSYELYFLFDYEYIKVPDADYLFYSSISDSLNYLGKENKFLSLNILFPNNYSGMVPYHYFDLWVNAFVSRLFSCPSIYSLLLVTYPLINIIVFIGLVASWELFEKPPQYSFFVIFVLFFIGGVNLPFYNNFIEFFDFNAALTSSPFSLYGQKLSVIYLFFTASFLTFIRGDKVFSFLWLSIIVIAFAGVLPAVLGCVVVFLITNKIHKTFSLYDAIKLFIFYIGIVVLFFVIYFCWEPSSYTSSYVAENNFIKTLIDNPFKINNYKLMIGDIGYKLSRSAIYYYPFIFFFLLCFFLFLKNHKSLFLFSFIVGLINLIGLFASGLANGLMDSGQLFSNTFAFNNSLLMFISIFFVSKHFYFVNTSKKILKVVSYMLLIIAIAFNVLNNIRIKSDSYKILFSNDYFKQVQDEVDDKNYILANCLYSLHNYNETNFGWMYRNRPGVSVFFNNGYKDIINLNPYMVDSINNALSNYDKYNYKNSEFILFTEKQRQNQAFISFEKSQLEFISLNKIKYLFVNKDAKISSLLKTKVKKEFFDSKSHERFLILKD